MIKKSICTLLLCVPLISFASAEDEAKYVCNQLQGDTKEFQSQLPLKINYMTTAVGASTYYLSGVCNVNFHYVLNSDTYINNLEDHQFSYQETLDYLKSSEGAEYMKSQMELAASNSFESLLEPVKKYRNVTINVNYRWSNPSIKPIDIVILDTRK